MDIDYTAPLPTVAAEYHSEKVGGAQPPTSGTWHLWRETDRVQRDFQTSKTTEVWRKDGGALFHVKYFHEALGYPSKLVADSKTKQLRAIADLGKVVASMPTALPKSSAYEALLVPGRRVTALIHEDVASSQANEFEAKIVAGIAYCLRHSMAQEPDLGVSGAATPFTDDAFFKDGIGIVTPHKAQKALVIKELTALFPNADPKRVFEAVDTVERFQGGERQTIIVSFGVGDTDVIEGEEEFLLQMERTNVAVSRAKSKCIVLMPKSLAYHLPTDQKAAETAVAIKSYIEEFCSNRAAITVLDGSVQRDAEVRWH